MPQNKVQKKGTFPVKCGSPASPKQIFIFLDYFKITSVSHALFLHPIKLNWEHNCKQRVFPYREAQKIFEYIIDSSIVYKAI